MLMMFLRWALNAAALMVVPALIDSVSISGFGPALIAALIIGLLNTLIRPLLIVLTLPVTVLSLGFFALIINGLLFWLTAELVEGVSVRGFWGAFWGALLYSILSSLVDLVVGKPR